MQKKLLILFAILLAVAASTSMYLTRREAGRQAKVIEAADLKGDSVTSELAILKAYSSGHMYSGVNVTLVGSFNRAQAASVAATQAANASAQIYATAQKICAGKGDSVTQSKCNSNYIASQLANLPVLTPVPAPQPEEYQYRFSSPLWAPDLSGVLVLASVLFSLWWSMLSLRSRRQS